MEINEKEVFVEFEKNSRQKVKLSLSEFKGKKLVDLRIWYLDKEEDTYKPSKKGLSISIDKFDELKQSITAFESLIEDRE
jgi:hypothetical protein